MDQLCPKLEWIQSTWAGVDALAGHIPAGVVVTPLKHVFGQSMSEFVLAGYWRWSVASSIERKLQSGMTRPRWAYWEKPWAYWHGQYRKCRRKTAQHFGIQCRGLNSDGRPVEGFETCFKAGDHRFFDDLDYVVSVLPKPLTPRMLSALRTLQRLRPAAL